MTAPECGNHGNEHPDALVKGQTFTAGIKNLRKCRFMLIRTRIVEDPGDGEVFRMPTNALNDVRLSNRLHDDLEEKLNREAC